MDRLALGVLAAGLCIALLLLVVRTWRADRVRRNARSEYLGTCAQLFADVRTGEGTAGFPRLAGRYGGETFDIQAVPDTLTFRKLPTLWILVTLPGALPVRATLDLMIRPMGVETFSHFHKLPVQLHVPEGYPEDCALRTDAPDAVLAEHVLRPHLQLFDDQTVKELVISPRGLRIGFLADEAHRGRYLIFRDSEMGQSPLPPERLRPHLDALLALKAAITAAATPDAVRLSA